MRVTSLALTNWKGITETNELRSLNLLIGPNGSGKTARLEALRWAITGETSLGKKPESAAAFVGHKGGQVGVMLDSGFAWTRTIAIDPKTGGVSTSIMVAGHESLGVREAHAMVTKECGSFAPMFDLGAFTNLSPDKQRDTIMVLCGEASGANSGDVVTQCLIEYLKAELGEAAIALAFVDDATPNAASVDALTARLAQAQRDALADIRMDLGHHICASPIEGIAVSIDRLRSIKNASKTLKDQALQAQKRLLAQRQEIAVVAQTEQQLQEAVNELSERRTELREQIASQRGRNDAIEALRKSRNADDARLEGIRCSIKLHSEAALRPATDADDLDAQADMLLAETPEPADIGELRESAEEAKLNAHTAERQYTAALLECHELSARCEGLRREIESMEGDDWQLVSDAINRLPEQVDPQHLEPVTVSNAWVDIVNIVNRRSRDDEVSQYKQRLADLVCEHEQKLRECALLEKSQGELLAVSRDADDLLSSAIREQERIGKRRAEACQQAAEMQREAIAIRDAIEAHNKRHEELQAQLKDAINQAVDSERRLNELDSAGGFVPIEELEGALSANDDELSSTQGRLKQRQRFAVLERELMQCVASAEKETVRWEVCRDMETAMKRVREGLMESLTAPLVDRITTFLQGVNGAKAYCRLANAKGKPIFDLGWQLGDQRRSHAAMSSGEQAVFGAGLAAALVDLADPPLRLLLIEAGALDRSAHDQLFSSFGAIDNAQWTVLVATHVEGWQFDSVPDGANLIQIGAECLPTN